MTDPLSDYLKRRVDAAVPPTLPDFETVRRRAGHRPWVPVLAAAAAVVLVLGAMLTVRGLRDSGATPLQPAHSTSPLPTTPNVAITVDPDLPDSGIVVHLPAQELALPADDLCLKQEDCQRVLMHDQTGPDLGSPEALEFTFVRPDWDFTATFTRLGAECPRATTVQAERQGDRYRLEPADAAGTYQVDLRGRGGNGFVSTRFVWTTTTDGPIEPPLGQLQISPDTGGAEPAYWLELLFTDLPFQPTLAQVGREAKLTVTAADGRTTHLDIPLVRPALPCVERGTFYYQGDWRADVSSLGPTPLELQVTVRILNVEYLGRGTWSGPAGDVNFVPYTPLTWTPELFPRTPE